MIRVMGYSSFLRFVRNVRNKTRILVADISALSLKERDFGFLKIVQMIQEDDFHEEIRTLESGLVLKHYNLQKLNPFLENLPLTI